MSVPALPKLAERLSSVLYQERDAFLRLDYRTYPSKNMRKGYSEKHMERFSPMLAIIIRCEAESAETLTQPTLEASIDGLNARTKDALKKVNNSFDEINSYEQKT